MTDRDFLINIRRILLSAVTLIDKRIEALVCERPGVYLMQESTPDNRVQVDQKG